MNRKSVITIFSVFLFFLVLGGCGDDGEVRQRPVVLPTDLAEGWNIIHPGGDTVCARGTEYAYAVYKGSVNKLVIDFMGGGACWDAQTCSFSDSLFNEEVDMDALQEEGREGIYDKDNPDNPFRDWYHVFIPYCTGDIHWGDNVVEYEQFGQKFTIHHKGRVNAGTVLDWVYDHFSNPETIFVTGCSAGAYGAIGWAPHIMDHYPNSHVYEFGDSGAGVITDTFFEDSFPVWNASGILPEFIPELAPSSVDILTLDMADIYSAVGRFFSNQTVSMYNTEFDGTQTFFYTAMGGDGGPEEWSRKMKVTLRDARARTDNFFAFTAPGSKHCILPYDDFYTVEADGVPLVRWLTDMIDGRAIEPMPGLEESGS